MKSKNCEIEHHENTMLFRRGGGSLNGYLAPGGDSGDVEDDDLAGYGAGDQGRRSKYYG